jgi:hypothetical protein
MKAGAGGEQFGTLDDVIMSVYTSNYSAIKAREQRNCLEKNGMVCGFWDGI